MPEGEGFEPSMEETTPITVFEYAARLANRPCLLTFSAFAASVG